MGFLNKIKDLFIDEEEIIEEKEIEPEKKEEHKLPTFMREKIEKEQKVEEQKKAITEKKPEPIEKVSDRDLTKDNEKFRFPIAFEEKDFDTTLYSRQNVMKKEQEKPKKVAELYATKKDVMDKPKKFMATPIISPVYGVLDQNYKKDELKEKQEENYEIRRASNKKVDFESVRKKAFGSLTDDIKDNLLCENCELLKEAKKLEKLESDDLLFDLTTEEEKKEVTLEDAEDNYYDFGVAYEQPVQKETEEVIINNNNEKEDPESEKVTTEEVIEETIEIPTLYTDKQEEIPEKDPEVIEKKEEPKKDDLELTDDLFNLIDSMYKEGEE